MVKTKVMKYNNLIWPVLASASLAVVSCNKDYKVTEPGFDVAAPAVVRCGEAVDFLFEGNADIITFYSGEPGNSYEYADTERMEDASMVMSFRTITSSGTRGNANPSSLPIYYSTDYTGENTPEAINSATWTEITDRFDMPDDTEQQIPSGDVYVNDIFPEDGSPVYIMMKYSVSKFDESKQNGRTQWNIQDFKISGRTQSGMSTVYDIFACGWSFVMGPGTDKIVSQFPLLPGASARLLLRVDFRPAEDMCFWTVSKPLHRAERVNLGRDSGIGIKAVSDPHLESYRHIYKEPGEYKVTFVAANSNINGKKQVVKEMTVKVTGASGEIAGPEFDEWQ